MDIPSITLEPLIQEIAYGLDSAKQYPEWQDEALVLEAQVVACLERLHDEITPQQSLLPCQSIIEFYETHVAVITFLRRMLSDGLALATQRG